MKVKIGKSTINIVLKCENDNCCEPKDFTQINNYSEPKKVLIRGFKFEFDRTRKKKRN